MGFLRVSHPSPLLSLVDDLTYNPVITAAINICPDSGTKPTFPDIDYSFYGYNVLKGYPMAEGSDPGFTRPVFAFDYESGSSTADCRYLELSHRGCLVEVNIVCQVCLKYVMALF